MAVRAVQQDEVVSATVPGLARAPEVIRRLTTFDRVDYVDVTTAVTSRGSEKTPEQWARAVLEDAPFSARNAPVVWRALGLHLGPRPSPDYIQGWKIAGRGDEWIRVETSSWYMSGEAVLHVDDDRVSIALFLRFDRPLARLVWLVVGPGHRRGVPVMVRQALRVP